MRFALLLSAIGASVVAVAASAAGLPPALQGAGLWEISRSASGSGSERRCLSDPALLAQWEHRGQHCTRVVVASAASGTQIHFTCVGGDFGTSRISVLTPRSVRIQTQGIAKGAPFGYTLHARRIGNCLPR